MKKRELPDGHQWVPTNSSSEWIQAYKCSECSVLIFRYATSEHDNPPWKVVGEFFEAIMGGSSDTSCEEIQRTILMNGVLQ